MRLKRLLALLFAMVMVIALVAACTPADEPDDTNGGDVANGGDAGAAYGPDNPHPDSLERMGNELAELLGLPTTPLAYMPDIEFTIFTRNMGIPGIQENPFLQMVREITGVTINIQFLVGDINTTWGTMLAGGIEQDAVFVGGLATEAIAAGNRIIPICDLIEQHAPNLRAHYDEWWEQMKAEDGNIYTAEIWGTHFGETEIEFFNQTAWYLQKSVIDYHGRAPENFDELFEFVYQYMETHPTIDGMTTLGVEIGINAQTWMFTNPPLFLAGNPNWGFAGYNRGGNRADAVLDLAPIHTREWQEANARPYYAKINEMIHRVTSHGQPVIDPETFTRSSTAFESVIANGQVLLIPGQQWVWEAATNTLISADLHERTHLPLDFIWDHIDEYNYWAGAGAGFAGNNGLNISMQAQDPIRFIQFLDWIVQEPVQRFLSWGINRDTYNANTALLHAFGVADGYHYFYNDEGIIERPQVMRDLQGDSRWERNNMGRQLRDMLPKIQGQFLSDGNMVGASDSIAEYLAGLSDFDREFFERHNMTHFTDFLRSRPESRPVFYPLWGTDPAPGSDADTFGIETGFDGGGIDFRHLVPLVTSPPEEFDERWEAYMDELIGFVEANPHLLEAHMTFFTELAQRSIDAAGG